MRRILASVFLASGLALSPCHAQEAGMRLSLHQGRAMAMHSLQTGKPQLALALSDALLKANSKDHVAWYLRAAAYSRLKDPEAARKSVGRAYRFAKEPGEKYQTAQMASRLAFAEGRPGLSQFWLRRTAIHAPDAQAQALIAEDYKTLRRINPWAIKLRTEVKPSSNVNNGSDSAIEIIDGVPTAGSVLGPRSVALSGLIGIADATVSRRLRQSSRSRTALSGRLYLQRVALSESAKKKAREIVDSRPGFTMPRNSEFASSYGEITLSHAFAVGPEAGKGSAQAALSAATSWYGGEKNYDLLRLSGGRSWKVSPAASIRLNGSAEQRFNPRSLFYDASTLGLGASLSRSLENGGRFDVALGLRGTDSAHPNTTYNTATVRFGYTFGEKIGPAKLSGGLILGYSDYQDFFRTADGFALSDGRQDHSLYADVGMFFEDYDYAGFAPMLRLRAGKRRSNYARYEGSEFSVSLGIESKF
ncbi:DUF560 domain-containing protein [Leisingera aquaemixtae]|nr:DUF560 domain-containing protein [Leisingera aquaemixtae]